MSHTAAEACYYADPAACDGDPWECLTCHESFCSGGHWHLTSLGQNVECVACERERVEGVV